MIDRNQIRQAIGRVLRKAEMHSLAAENLLMGTMAQESRFGTYIRQMGNGPARGIFQMEPATEADIWENYLRHRPGLSAAVTAVSGVSGPDPDSMELNIAYQIIMARVHYRRVPAPLPAAGDVYGLARYWKEFYNTPLGAGTAVEFVENYHRYVEA